MGELGVLLGLERFVVEFWRLGPRGFAGLSVAQGLALLLIAVGLSGRIVVAAKQSRVMGVVHPSGFLN